MRCTTILYTSVSSPDRQTVDIFTKPLGLDKLRKFLGALGLQHLDVPNLRGRRREEEVQAESDEEFDFVTAEEVEDGYGGSDRRKEPGPEPTKKGGDKAKKGKKARTKTWLDVVKGLKTEDELETTNSNKNGNGSETTDLVEQLDSEEPNQLKAKQTRSRCRYRGADGLRCTKVMAAKEVRCGMLIPYRQIT